ncbi:MAG: alanine--tRNA ligase [Sphaerobacteraceae bacterium]|nr:MAG: alanine--tRNA ligase [Sphaerobacteraceae bacterium]
MNSAEIRRRFIEFFAEREHRHVASSSLVPLNDPTVLLTTAGMQQMTPYFLGLETAPASRMTSIQKCFRTVDIDEVGDESHLTFFEMLGNFSVGDYFKAEAITWAWELITDHFEIPVDRLHVSVHYDDEFSWNFWQSEIGLPVSQIRKLGDEDNWWGPVGETGPNGPDSEIFYDRGEQYGCGREECGPGCDCGRFLEFWNLVFMEYFKEADGTQRPLPSKNIDTGMGLERIASILQGTETVFETDLYMPIIQHVSELTGVNYGESERGDMSLRVIADHARAVTFLISDGVFPGNEGRSYVLRRVLRRAVRHGRLLGLEKPFLSSVARRVAAEFGEHYPDLTGQLSRIQKVIDHEEAHFSQTLATGIDRFEAVLERMKTAGESRVPGEEAFRLYDTYGFPLELTEELAADHDLTVDRAGFEKAMERQRQSSRAGASQGDRQDEQHITAIRGTFAGIQTEFVGYDHHEATATISGIVAENAASDQVVAGMTATIALSQTPFYAESGGQVGDVGEIASDTGTFIVHDTQRPMPGVIVHYGEVRDGFLERGTTVLARVDAERRLKIRRNHTATHLLHAALRSTLGDHAQQAGSLVAPDRLRFDFTNLEPVGSERLRDIQQQVATQIIRDSSVNSDVTTYDDAISRGAMALFGEKYGDEVRMISIDGYSRELCGGTHVDRTGEIGPFVITEETSVASGVRRIEAVTGDAAIDYLLHLQTTVETLERDLHVPVDQLVDQARSLQQRIREHEREIERLRVQMAASQVDDIVDAASDIDGVTLVSAVVAVPSRDVLLQLADRCRDKLGSAVIVLGADIDDRPALLAIVTKDLVERGVHAGKLIGEIASHVGGKGGGRPEMAQGGGTDASKISDAVGAAQNAVRQQLSGS